MRTAHSNSDIQSSSRQQKHFGTFYSTFFLSHSYFSAPFGELLRYYKIVGIELEPQLNQHNTSEERARERQSAVQPNALTSRCGRRRHRRSNQKNDRMYVTLCVIDIHIRRVGRLCHMYMFACVFRAYCSRWVLIRNVNVKQIGAGVSWSTPMHHQSNNSQAKR